ncbi:uncharacterized protein [Euphorbia lathyris]|uniref:uncharacterized protein n=1 Tax=Euphorbia lathyris TaxID=212925 RepID=UPI0033143B6F
MGRKPMSVTPKNADKSHKSVNNAEGEMDDNPCLASLKKKKRISSTQDNKMDVQETTKTLKKKKNKSPLGIRRSERLQEPTPQTMDDKLLHDKIDFLLQLVQAQQKTIDELKSKRIEKCCFADNSGKYKSMYFDSQKKIEALIKENNELSTKLEYAHAQMELLKKAEEEISEKVEEMGFILCRSSGTINANQTLEPKGKRGPN